jgi:diguanylate cyclase (GGDEF)-like protein/PAS domain S-box-containing protein
MSDAVDNRGMIGVDDDTLDRLCMRNLLDAADEVIYFKDRQSRFVRVSNGMRALHLRGAEEILGKTDFDLFAGEHASQAYADEQQIIATGIPVVNKEERETWPDRGDTWVTTTKLPLRNDDGEIIGTFGISRDVTRRVLAEQQSRADAEALAAANEELRRTASELATLLETSPDAIARYDADLRYCYVNPAAERALQKRASDIVGRTDAELGHSEPFESTWSAALHKVLATGQRHDTEFALGSGEHVRWFHAQLVPDLDAEGRVMGIFASTRELTAQKRAEQALAHQALHDAVTGLANRVLFADRLAQALVRMERQPGRIAVLFVDLDHFKDVNDSLGHGVGDWLLNEVGNRLRRASRRIDTVARFGGDEFVLLCDKLRAEEDVRLVADRIVRALYEPFVRDGLNLRISGSVGIVVTDSPSANPSDLVRDADAAMYQAKERGRNRFQFFEPSIRDKANARHTLEAELRLALERDEFVLHYQPLYSLSGGGLVGVEALLRWDHPVRGQLAPGEFIGVAEDRALIIPLGSWVLREACRQLAAWDAQYGERGCPLTMAVNVSGGQLRDPQFYQLVRDCLAEHRIAPARLCLEITETALIEEAAGAHPTLVRLTELGVHLALDDFGTGYSSLAHLRNFPVDMLKIDRSFIDRLDQNDRERQIVAAVTAMAHALGMTVIGEGIERDTQLGELTELECDDGQGFLLARPVAPAGIAALLEQEADANAPGRVA